MPGKFNLEGYLTLSEFRKITADLPGDVLINIAGSQSVIVQLEEESLVSPKTLVLDSDDIEVSPDANVLFRVTEEDNHDEVF